MANTTRKSAVDQDKLLIAGIQKYLVNQPFIFAKQSLTAQDVIKVLQARIDAGNAVIPAKTAWVAAVKTDKDERAKTSAFVRGIKSVVYGMFNEAPDMLAEFGLSPRKSSKKTVAVKAEAIAKSLATREARGTKGKRQKEKVKGTVAEGAHGASSAPAPQPAPEPHAPAPVAPVTKA